MDLHELAGAYVEQHDEFLGAAYCEQLQYAAQSFSRFLGAHSRPDHLTRELINAYLGWLADKGRAAATLKSRRGALMVLARFAAETGELSEVPAVKRIRIGQRIPEAWTADEIRALVAQCRLLRGAFNRTGIPRRHYMAGLVIGLYDSGLRLGDAWRLKRRDVAWDGSFVVLQGKTRREVTRRFSPAAVFEIDASGANDRDRIWPLWGRKEAFFALVRRLVRDAGIRRGTLRWLRRAGVTAVVRNQGLEAGQRFADHRSPQTTRDHYVDLRQLGEAPQPPPLE